ncbi:Fanconi anemia group F protein [Pyxicephalus adspersus]|uniref:Fanconi anemia group F protein n=1 Tax=Pyxicephalus adspersus TaxID=30357 RepID=A0AAV3A919_PYXAD|nr:TPA: hypothetical protein GDO54_017522 [Pyxicephalus adspersus]
MAIKMEGNTMVDKFQSVLENLDNFVDMLALSHTAHVKDWDVQNVQRILEWGSYFQQVSHRFKDSETIRNAIEDHLAKKNKELSVQFKNYKYITIKDLERGRDIVCMALLCNNAVSTFVFKYLLELLGDSDREKDDSICLDHMLSRKVASELFLSLPLFTCERSQTDNPVLVTQADILRSNLQSRIKTLEDGHKLPAVSEILTKLPKPSVYHLITAVLLSIDTSSALHCDQLYDLILDWLLSNDNSLTGLCSNVDPQNLVKLSSRFFKFRQTYLDYLVRLGQGMEQDVTFGTWASNIPKLSFGELLGHFKCLLGGPDDLKECTLTRLQTLKSQDGDFEEPGISIWTDILTELNKS